MTGCLFWQKRPPFNRFQSPAPGLGGDHTDKWESRGWGRPMGLPDPAAGLGSRGHRGWMGTERGPAGMERGPVGMERGPVGLEWGPVLAGALGLGAHTAGGGGTNPGVLPPARARPHAHIHTLPPAPAPSSRPGLSWSLGSPSEISKEAFFFLINK